MVDTYDLFRKLSSGAKFDRKKLPKEITPFRVSRLKNIIVSNVKMT
jgi:hypothetical protein